MNWYYAVSGQQKGPVADAEFEALIQSGVIRPDTLVWHEGLAAWQKLSEVRPAAGAPPGGLPPLVAADAAGTPPPHGTASEAEVRARDYEHDVSDYVGRAWALFKSDPWMMIGGTLLVYVCLFAANGIPYLGAVLGLIFTGPLIGGLILFMLRKVRGQSAAVGDAFGGFGPRFGQLLLGHLIPSLLAGLALIPMIVLLVVGIFVFGVGRHGSPPPTAVMVPLIVVGGLFTLAGICVAVYLQTCWMFTLWLVADKRMEFWPAMSLSRAVVKKHWWMSFLLTIVAGLISMAGMLACCVGLLVAGPVAIAMVAMAYERLFGDLQPRRE